MDRAALEQKLKDIRFRQEKLESAWKKTGNRELLEFFIDIMPRVLDVERCSIFVLDPEDDKVWLQAGTGLKERQVVVPTKGSIVGRVIAGGKTLIDMDLQTSVGEHDVVAMKTGFVVRNTLCVPVFGVKNPKDVVGAIQVLNKRRQSEYSESDIKTLERLACLMRMNIENIYLRQEIVKVSEEMKKKIERLEELLQS
jgi:Nif-specific regulatory protein/two-component system response regulator HydG